MHELRCRHCNRFIWSYSQCCEYCPSLRKDKKFKLATVSLILLTIIMIVFFVIIFYRADFFKGSVITQCLMVLCSGTWILNIAFWGCLRIDNSSSKERKSDVEEMREFPEEERDFGEKLRRMREREFAMLDAIDAEWEFRENYGHAITTDKAILLPNGSVVLFPDCKPIDTLKENNNVEIVLPGRDSSVSLGKYSKNKKVESEQYKGVRKLTLD